MSTNFSIEFRNRSLLDNPEPSPDVEFVVERYSKSVVGGPKQAIVTAYGSIEELWHLVTRLRQGVVIYDGDGRKVWWGFLHTITIRVGRSQVTFSLENMYNKVKVIYTNFNTRFSTASTSGSISQNTYGVKELIRAISDATEEEAIQLRDTILSNQEFPHANIEFSSETEGSQSARLEFRGWIETLKWQYYQQTKGLESHTTSGTGIQKVGVAYSSSTISFVASNKINDSDNGLTAFEKDDVISIAGTTNNNGEFQVSQGTSTGAQIQTVETTVVTEAAGTVFTIADATLVMQDFIQTSGSAWEATSVHVRAQTVGSPTDYLNAEIYNDVSGSPSVLQSSGSLAASNMSNSMTWREIDISATNISNNTRYWLVIRRTDPNNASGIHYYRVDVDESQGYSSGSMQIYSGCTWRARTVNADMLFRIVGTQETTSQISEMIDSTGEFLNSTEIIDNSGVDTNQWRDGESTTLDEIIRLINTGTTANRRLMFDITPTRDVVIREEPGESLNVYLLYANGDMFTRRGIPVRKQDATVGIWAKLVDVVPGNIAKAQTINPDTIFIEEAEYFVQSDVYIPKARISDSPWQIGLITGG